MIRRMFAHGSRLASLLVLAIGLGQVAAAPPAPPPPPPPPPEQLFPAATTEFVAISDMTRLGVDWQKTQVAQLMRDPAMKPFRDQLAPNNKGFNFLLDTIGVSADSIKMACAGDLAWAVVLASPTKVSHVLTMDVTNRDVGLQKLFNEMGKSLIKQEGQWKKAEIEGFDGIVFTLPKNVQIIYGLKGNLLIVADHLPTL